MFKAMIMVCFINVPTACIQFEDTTGLKELEEHCYIRTLRNDRGIQKIFRT